MNTDSLTTGTTADHVRQRMMLIPRNGHCHVIPRYSGGSPAMVDDGTAFQVALQEFEGYEMALSGSYGEEAKQRATTLGLANIVYGRWEKGRQVWRVDLLTGDMFVEPPRLETLDIARAYNLQLQRAYLSRSQAQELADLEQRAKIHRQEIRNV